MKDRQISHKRPEGLVKRDLIIFRKKRIILNE